MFYVYLIESLSTQEQRYVGLTADLKRRLEEHNTGKSPHTAKYRPWRLIAYIGFSDRAKAESFERYLKSGSGMPSRPNACGEGYRGIQHLSRSVKASIFSASYPIAVASPALLPVPGMARPYTVLGLACAAHGHVM